MNKKLNVLTVKTLLCSFGDEVEGIFNAPLDFEQMHERMAQVERFFERNSDFIDFIEMLDKEE